MKAEQVDQAVEAGYRSSHADMPRVISRCEWAAGAHAFLKVLEQNAGFVKGVIIRAVMGWLTDYQRRNRCQD